jgi:hypothetical protein
MPFTRGFTERNGRRRVFRLRPGIEISPSCALRRRTAGALQHCSTPTDGIREAQQRSQNTIRSEGALR